MRAACLEIRIRFVAAVCGMMAVLAATAAIAADVHQVTLVMREFKFEPATIRLQAGEEVALTVRNSGKSTHEWLVGSGLVKGPDGKGFQQDLFALLAPAQTGKGYSLERAGLASKAEAIPRVSTGVRVEPGGAVVLRFNVPPSARGEWQMGCFISGHYETGMRGTLLIE